MFPAIGTYGQCVSWANNMWSFVIQIRLIQGDIFELSKIDPLGVDFVYDRAAMVALNVCLSLL